MIFMFNFLLPLVESLLLVVHPAAPDSWLAGHNHSEELCESEKELPAFGSRLTERAEAWLGISLWLWQRVLHHRVLCLQGVCGPGVGDVRALGRSFKRVRGSDWPEVSPFLVFFLTNTLVTPHCTRIRCLYPEGAQKELTRSSFCPQNHFWMFPSEF